MLNVLVFPSCNEPGLEVIHALARSPRFRVIGGSSFDVRFDPSRVLLRTHLTCPSLHDPDFKPRFVSLLRTHGIDLVFGLTDALVAEFATWDDVDGVTFVVPSADAAQVCADKRLTYERLRGVVPIPDIYGADEMPPLPAFAKPPRGGGSRDTHLLTTTDHVVAARQRGQVIQELLPGDEYTVDCIGDRDGRLLFAHPRRRAFIGRSISLGTVAEPMPELVAHAEAIAKAMPIAGPWFAQFKRAADGEPKLLEVNARVGGSMTLTRLAGVNIPAIAAFSFAGHDIVVPRVVEHAFLVRSLRNLGEIHDFDLVVWDLDDTLVRKDGKADAEMIGRLYDFHNQGKRQVLVTRNVDPAAMLARHHIPPFFEQVVKTDDKVQALRPLLDELGVTERRAVMINDSNAERIAIQPVYPALRIFTPDAVEMLERERIE